MVYSIFCLSPSVWGFRRSILSMKSHWPGPKIDCPHLPLRRLLARMRAVPWQDKVWEGLNVNRTTLCIRSFSVLSTDYFCGARCVQTHPNPARCTKQSRRVCILGLGLQEVVWLPDYLDSNGDIAVTARLAQSKSKGESQGCELLPNFFLKALSIGFWPSGPPCTGTIPALPPSNLLSICKSTCVSGKARSFHLPPAHLLGKASKLTLSLVVVGKRLAGEGGRWPLAIPSSGGFSEHISSF